MKGYLTQKKRTFCKLLTFLLQTSLKSLRTPMSSQSSKDAKALENFKFREKCVFSLSGFGRREGGATKNVYRNCALSFGHNMLNISTITISCIPDSEGQLRRKPEEGESKGAAFLFKAETTLSDGVPANLLYSSALILTNIILLGNCAVNGCECLFKLKHTHTKIF